MNSDPNDKKRRAGFGRDSKVFRISHRQRFSIGEMQLKRAERCPVTHFPEIRDLHISQSILNGSLEIFN